MSTHVHPTYRAHTPWGEWKDLGTGPAQPVTKPYDWLHPMGTVYVCPVCGETWGIVAYPAGHRFRAQNKLCALHGDGSFLNWSTRPKDIAQLPEGVIAYEFTLVMRQTECTNLSSSAYSSKLFGLSA